jgi:DNA-binding transcriptional LysR family regulator
VFSTVEMRDIRAFLAVSEELHFGRAGERLGLTPSRVSQTIRMLETRAAGRLFDRNSRSVTLTPLGEQLLRDVRPAYERLARAFGAAREAAAGIAGELRLGMYTPVNGGPHLVEIIKTYEARHPACEVTLTDTGLDRDQLDLLQADELDILATRLPLSDPEITIGPVLSTEERILAVAANHPLADRDSVCIEDLADYHVSDVSTLPRELMDAFIPPRTPSGRLLRRVDNRRVSEVLIHVALGEFVHPTVRSFLDYYGHPGVTAVPIRDLPPSQTALVWLTSNDAAKVHAFVRAASDVLAAS